MEILTHLFSTKTFSPVSADPGYQGHMLNMLMNTSGQNLIHVGGVFLCNWASMIQLPLFTHPPFCLC